MIFQSSFTISARQASCRRSKQETARWIRLSQQNLTTQGRRDGGMSTVDPRCRFSAVSRLASGLPLPNSLLIFQTPNIMPSIKVARLVSTDKPLELGTVEKPVPGPKDVLVKVSACNVVPNTFNLEK